MASDNFPQPIIKSLRERVASRCSNPDCGIPTTTASDESINPVNNGVAAQICTAAEGGARYKAEMTAEECKSFHNGIWLCGNCAINIAKDEKTYTEAVLKQWKFQAEKTAAVESGQNSAAVVPQKLVASLLKKLDEQEIKLPKRDGIIAEWTEKYQALKKQLSKQKAEIAKQAEDLLAAGELDNLQNSLTERLAKDLETAAANAFALAQIQMLQLNDAEAKNYLQQAVQLAPENWMYLEGLNSHLKRLGEYVEAERVLKAGLTILESTFGKDHPNVAECLNSLALLYKTRGQYQKAKPFYQRSLTILEKTLSKDDPDLTIGWMNLAELYRIQGEYLQAEPFYHRSLAVLQKSLGKNHLKVSDCWHNLAEFYRTQGQYQQAEPLYLGSLAIRETALGQEHPDVALSLNNLAELYYQQGKYAQAEPLFQRSLTVLEKTLGKDHPNMASNLNNLAVLYSAQGKGEQAEPLYQRSLLIREQALGKYHPDVDSDLNNLFIHYYEQGKYSQCEPLLQRRLEISEKNWGENHPNVASNLNNLAVLYCRQDKHQQAEPLLKRAVQIMEISLGKNHPSTQDAQQNYAVLLDKLKTTPSLSKL